MGISIAAVTPKIRAANESIIGLIEIAATRADQALGALHDPSALRSRDISRLVSHASAGADELQRALQQADSLADNLFVNHGSIRQAHWAEQSLRKAIDSAELYPISQQKAYTRGSIVEALTDARDRANVAVEVGRKTLSFDGQGASIASESRSVIDEAADSASDAGIRGFIEPGLDSIDPMFANTRRGYDAIDPMFEPRYATGADDWVDGGAGGYAGGHLI